LRDQKYIYAKITRPKMYLASVEVGFSPIGIEGEENKYIE
jgi:hypothetical protein